RKDIDPIFLINNTAAKTIVAPFSRLLANQCSFLDSHSIPHLSDSLWRSLVKTTQGPPIATPPPPPVRTLSTASRPALSCHSCSGGVSVRTGSFSFISAVFLW